MSTVLQEYDVQLYCSFDPKSSSGFHNAVAVIEKCVAEVNEWMIRNKLLMNEQKIRVSFDYFSKT